MVTVKKKTIKDGLNPKKKARIPAGWVSSRKKAYKQFRIDQARKMRERVPTDDEILIHARKLEIMRLHDGRV